MHNLPRGFGWGDNCLQGQLLTLHNIYNDICYSVTIYSQYISCLVYIYAIYLPWDLAVG